MFLVYTALSGIYLFLPPLLTVLYFYFSKALKKEQTSVLILTIFCLLFFESENSYVLFSTIIYFSILHKYIVPKITQSFSCVTCINFMIVLFVYVGFFLFYSFLSNIFLFALPAINYYVIYYIVIEFLILSIL
ncbi:conserved hypothetical protein [Sulfurimonas denitrificans DSM 1251]|uniref:Uncharacterized protein n=1 Tax=Sulfurimonas denitrificans (strain ATCC 33889 / DSM 1251) TaxID=326298 RepID=Q30RM9_SULDN|nr:conserved hypothetical protein [Sulfurimonas denitrificans DSM 1251]